MRRAPIPLCALLVGGLALAGCGRGAQQAFEPEVVWGPCPADVDITYLSRHECGTLTVLADRSEPDGPTVQLLVVKAWPVGVDNPPIRGAEIANKNIGDPAVPDGGLATGATRGAAIVIQAEARGAGPHSTPSLRCPEVDLLATTAAGARSDDPGLRRDFVGATKACGDRIRASGYDPADFGISAMAADIADLREALGTGIDAGLGSEGTMARVSWEYVRTHPNVEQVIADSPWFPDVDDLTGGVIGTREALVAMFDACTADPVCADAYPDLDQTWQDALDRLADRPIETSFQSNRGVAVPVVVDAPKLLRAARFALGGDGPGNLEQLPATIAAAADGTASDWLIETIAHDPMLCIGYRPFCAGQQEFSFGVYLTAFCAEQAPFIDTEALDDLIGDDPVYRAVFADSPYLDACAAWGVEPADPAVAGPIDTDIPVLLMSGQFDSFSPPSISHDQAARLPSTWAVTIPAMTHNVLGFSSCAADLRGRWRDDPHGPPDDHVCDDVTPTRLGALG